MKPTSESPAVGMLPPSRDEPTGVEYTNQLPNKGESRHRLGAGEEFMRVIAALTLAFSLSGPATAGVQFATYEGPSAVQVGVGGAKVVKDGVDFWTEGTPPRKFQILGYLTDTRGDGRFSGHVVGSSGIAKRVSAAGGDAAIVLDQNTVSRGIGAVAMPNGFGGVNMYGRAINKVSTTLAVVRYLPN